MKSSLKFFTRSTTIAIAVLALGACGDNSSEENPSGSAFIQDANAATHDPGLFYDLPPVPDNPDASLFGVDANHNGIRDDYELAILFSDLPQPVKDSALSAGKAYGKLMMVEVEEGDIDRGSALEILGKLVLAKACRTKMRELHQGAAWQESTYFNTLDRIEAKFKLQSILANLLEPEGYDLPHEQDPCAALAAR